MIRSTKTTNKFSNFKKKQNIKLFIQEYQKVCQFFVDQLWTLEKVPVLPPKEITKLAETWLSARAIQCSAKQASGIVRGTRKKNEQRMFIYNKLVEQKFFKKARKLKKIIDNSLISKPNLNKIQPELDSRFVKIDLKNKTSFDGWITLMSLGNKLKLILPFKKSKHFNQLVESGNIKSGVRLSNDGFTFMFDLPDVELKKCGETIGLDVGIKNTFITSDNQKSLKDKHGWNLDSIQQKLARKKKGSKSFKKAQNHRDNYIHWSLNQLNLSEIKILKLEKIYQLRKGRKSSRWLSHWTYTTLFDKLESLCLKSGVQILKVNPTYTSQRCSQCGYVRKSNRRGKLFKCNSCNFSCDADLNASKNIALDLVPIGKQERLQHKNRIGFYWNVVSQKPIVSDAN